MRKLALLAVLLLLVFVGTATAEFFSEKMHFQLQVVGQAAATETAWFGEPGEIREFSSTTILDYGAQQGLYYTMGTIRANQVETYILNVEWEESSVKIGVQKRENQVLVEYKDKKISIPWGEDLLLLDNNISWPWQLFYNFYREQPREEYRALIPQLVASNYDPIVSLEIVKETVQEPDPETGEVFVDLVLQLGGNMGVLRADEKGDVHFIMFGASKMERLDIQDTGAEEIE